MKNLNKPKIILVWIILLWHIFASGPQSKAQFNAGTIQNTLFLEFDEKTFNYFPAVHYNRVEGLFLGAGVKVKPRFLSQTMLTAEGGYGISNEEWRYKAGCYRDIFEHNKLRIGAQTFHTTESLDDWYISTVENSIAALFIKEDFMNYFSKEGFKVYLNQFYLQRDMQFRIEVANYDYLSMDRVTHWALLGKDKKFRENPAVVEMNETSVKIIASLDDRDNPLFPTRGTKVDAIYEHTQGDSSSHGVFLTMTQYQPTVGDQAIRTRTVIGARTGSNARQHLLEMGGLGTLPAYKDKEFQNGNRLILYSFRYLFRDALLKKLPLSFIPLYDALNSSILFDTGWLHYEEAAANFGTFPGFEKIQFRKMKTDIGFSLSVSDEMIVVDFAKRTDRSHDSWRITARSMLRF